MEKFIKQSIGPRTTDEFGLKRSRRVHQDLKALGISKSAAIRALRQYNMKLGKQSIWKKKGDVPVLIKKFMEWGYISAYLVGLLISFRNPIKYIKEYSKGRGMSFYHDCIDWLGGWPYEYASTDEIIKFCKERGFKLIKLKSVDGLSCNEYVFRRSEKFI